MTHYTVGDTGRENKVATKTSWEKKNKSHKSSPPSLGNPTTPPDPIADERLPGGGDIEIQHVISRRVHFEWWQFNGHHYP